MKNKNNFFTLFIPVLFLSVFLFRIDVAKADCWGDYNVCYENASDDSEVNSCYATYETCSATESDATSTTAEKECGTNAYAYEGDCYCESGFGEDDYGNCTAINLSSEKCEADTDCQTLVGADYVCKDGNCELDSYISECADDADCVRNYGTGSTCSGMLFKTCSASTESATTAVAQTNQSSTVTDKTTGKTVTVPAGSTINSDGSITYNGSTIASAGSVNTSSLTSSDTSSGSVSLCTNGSIGTTCSVSGGSSLSVVSGGTSYYSGSTFSTSSVAGLTGGACGAGFASIGGVCFPASTGLSSAPISVILANIFSWLMGLFTTFAIIAFIISGIQYLTSTGDTDQIEKAKHNAMYALLGVVIGLSGFVIVNAIAAALSGQSYSF